jgi:hypothetical protein
LGDVVEVAKDSLVDLRGRGLCQCFLLGFAGQEWEKDGQEEKMNRPSLESGDYKISFYRPVIVHPGCSFKTRYSRFSAFSPVI